MTTEFRHAVMDSLPLAIFTALRSARPGNPNDTAVIPGETARASAQSREEDPEASSVRPRDQNLFHRIVAGEHAFRRPAALVERCIAHRQLQTLQLLLDRLERGA